MANDVVIRGLFDVLDVELGETNKVRSEVITSLKQGFDDFLNEEGKGKSILDMSSAERESFMAEVNAMGGMMNSKDSANVKRVQLILQHTKDENASEIAKDAVELMRFINSKNITFTNSEHEVQRDVSTLLEERFSKEGLVIDEAELSTNSKIEKIAPETENE